MTNFTFDNTIDAAKIGSNGRHTVHCKVVGFWTDVITMYVERDYHNTNSWKIKISHSSGGRDTKEVESDIEAEINFANAIIAMAQFGKEIEQYFEQFETFHQSARIKYRAEWEAEQKAKQELIDGDVAMSEADAVSLINALSEAKEIRAVVRGSDSFKTVTCIIGGNKTFYVSGKRMSKKDIIALLTASSSKSVICDRAAPVTRKSIWA
jgi:hypothetical protein